MNGKFFLDTNTVIALLNGNESLTTLLQSATWVGITVITELEFLSFSGLTQQDKSLFEEFKTRIEVINLETRDTVLIQAICQVRKTYRLKLPDAIIAATALNQDATLISNDSIFARITEMALQTFPLA